MTLEEFKDILTRGYEQRGVEFKGAGPRSNKQLFAKVVRAVLGMANKRDGGRILLGVEDVGHVLTPKGLSAADLQTWNYDDVLAGVAEYADPFVEIELDKPVFDGLTFVLIHVAEFLETPVLCKKDYEGVLRSGGCYVRSRRKVETSEIPSHPDMRDLLDLSIEKGVRRFYRQAQSVQGTPDKSLADAAAFKAQLDTIR